MVIQRVKSVLQSWLSFASWIRLGADRVAAFEGQLDVVSPPGGGTRLTATLPLPGVSREDPPASGR
jgi:hypothetical protein